MAVKAVPDGFNTINCYLVVADADNAIEFYKTAFGATTGSIMRMANGALLHGELKIGNSTFMLTAENPEWGMKSPQTLGGSPVTMHMYVEDVDAVFKRALDAGCTVTAELMDAFWGDRYGKLKDPFGHEWGIATHKEDLTDEEIGKRAKEWFASTAGGNC